MQALIRGQSRETISTAVMGTVMDCHDQGFYLLGGMVPGDGAMGSWVHMRTGLPEPYWMVVPDLSEGAGIGRSAMSPSVLELPMSSDEMPVEVEDEPAVRHLRELMALGRDGKLAYLSGAGMGEADSARLISLVMGWVDEAGWERLDSLSRVAAQRNLGPGHVLERWINGRCQLLLALLLDDPSVGDSDLAAAYAVSHAVDLVLASYVSDLDVEDEVISLVPEDDLD